MVVDVREGPLDVEIRPAEYFPINQTQELDFQPAYRRSVHSWFLRRYFCFGRRRGWWADLQRWRWFWAWLGCSDRLLGEPAHARDWRARTAGGTAQLGVQTRDAAGGVAYIGRRSDWSARWEHRF